MINVIRGSPATAGLPSRLAAASRAFVLRQTRLRPVPGLEAIRLHLADEVLPLWRAVQVETGDPDAALPYWAFAWGGGLAIARYLARAPGGRRGPAGLRPRIGLGAVSRSPRCAPVRRAVTASDIDPFAVAAIGLNARANRHPDRRSCARDVLDEAPPDVDVVLAGDCWYEAGLAERVLPWLQRRPRLPGSTSWSATRAAATCPTDRARGDRPVRGPDDDRARGSRPQGRPRLHGPGPVTRK